MNGGQTERTATSSAKSASKTRPKGKTMKGARWDAYEHYVNQVAKLYARWLANKARRMFLNSRSVAALAARKGGG